MPGFNIEGYQWVGSAWVQTEDFDLLDSKNETKANSQVFHNSVRIFYYLKTSVYWVRGGLDEAKALQWTVLVGDYPRWAPLGASDPLLLSLKERQEGVKNTLLEATAQPLPKIPEEPIGLSPAYQNIVKASISHNLEKPQEITAADWQMILITCLYPEISRENLNKIQSKPELLIAYQGIVIFLMPERINRYTFKVDDSLPTIGQIYDYTARLILQELQAPSLNNPVLSDKKIGEINKDEILVARGFDSNQENILCALEKLFNDNQATLASVTNELSLYERQELNKLFNSVRLALPLTEWQSRIWDEFVIIVTEGDYTLEQFGEKLNAFKALDRNAEMTSLTEALMAEINNYLSPEHSQLFIVNRMRTNFSRSVILSLSEEQNDFLWNKINQKDLLGSGPWKAIPTSRILPIFSAFYDSCSREKWLERIRDPEVLETIKEILEFLPIDTNFSKLIEMLPIFDSQKELLVTRLLTTPSSESYQLEVLDSIRTFCGLELFDAVVFDSRATQRLRHHEIHALIDYYLSSEKIIRFLSNTNLCWRALQSRTDLISVLKQLWGDDMLKFLNFPIVQEVYRTVDNGESVANFFRHIQSDIKQHLTTTPEGHKLLTEYLRDLNELDQLFHLFVNQSDKIQFILTVLISKPYYFYWITDKLNKNSLNKDFMDHMRTPAFHEFLSSIEDPVKKNTFLQGTAYFMHINTSLSSLQSIVSFKMMAGGQFARPGITRILDTIDPSLRKKFILNENVMNEWMRSKGYADDSFRWLIKEYFKPGPVFNKDELHKISKIFQVPEDADFIQAYASPEDYKDYKASFKRPAEDSQAGSTKRQRKHK